MTDDPRIMPQPNRPPSEGSGQACAAVPTTERDLWLLRRRALIQEVKAIESYLGIDKKPERSNGSVSQVDVVK